ncbi:hypothetical protein EG327_004981 [Venturia inaequalis]|uniref:Uncharacterized protein n=1 Tax=Venturia inaequalis TaxID=5025 RepID=A0A8H3VBC3_VENIN|nr:hypothetical protein EG327_004981 [Venturia inaequalis]
MPIQRILRLPFADDRPDSFALLHMVADSNSPSQVKLTASAGEDAFRTTIKLHQLPNFRDAKYTGTDDEFDAALRKTLLLDSQNGALPQDLEKVEVVAEINQPKEGEKKLLTTMSLIWRRKVNNWNQKLGQVDLPVYTGLEQPDAFEWAEIAAKNFDDSRRHIETIEAQLATQAETIGKLQSQLDSIVNAKAEHEGVLLHKFTELINSKKVKIRDQQRVLGTAKLDPDAVARIAPATSRPRKAADSRSSKRKANARAEPSDDESSDGFEDLVVQDEEMDDASTPQDTSEDTEDERPAPSPVRTGMRRKIGGRAPVAEREKTETPEPVTTRSTRGASKAPEKGPEEDLPPPKRELPFARPKPIATGPKPNEDEDETDDDDEL